MGFANVRVGTQTKDAAPFLGTRPNISESHSEISTRVPFCITQAWLDGPMPPTPAGAAFTGGAGALLSASMRARMSSMSPRSSSISSVAPASPSVSPDARDS